MNVPPPGPASTPPVPVPEVEDALLSDTRAERDQWEWWNLLVLAGHHILLRLAWIFKTESVLIPAFLDIIAGPGWVRGCLPVFNQLAQRISPVFAASHLAGTPLKKYWLMRTTSVMAIIFIALALLCTRLGTNPMPWLPIVFLLLYSCFFAATGVNQLTFNTLQGKLIRPHHRGRLMSLGGMSSSVVAILMAYLLLGRWLAQPDGRGYAMIFGFTGMVFGLSSMILFWLHEPPDQTRRVKITASNQFRNVWTTLRGNPSLQRVSIVAALFMTMMLLFPHYQWLGREKLHTTGQDLMWWVLVQNGGVGILSWLTGTMADRFGNRIVIRYELFACALIPLIAWFLSEWLTVETRGWYTITFFLLGLNPVTIKTLNNYVLELAHEEHHAHYLSTLNLCMIVPFVASPLVGWIIDRNHQLVLGSIAVTVFLGALLTFRMHEPRHHQTE